MKKIVFVLPHMLCGGVEKSLLSLINEIPTDKYDITILFVKLEGEFINLIPSNVKKEEIPIPNDIRDDLMLGGIKKSLKYHIKTCNFKKVFKVCKAIIQKDPIATLTINFNEIRGLSEEYDIAICYHIHMPFIVRYVSEKISAKRKIAWVHNDFNSSGYKVEGLIKYMKNYDHFFCVSKQLKEEFINIIPEFRNRTSIAYNIISELYIKNQSKEFDVEEYTNDGTIKILTIGRLDYQKGYDMALKVCRNLVSKGYKIKWFALGSGCEETNIKRTIKEYNLEDKFILLGVRTNPYPYIKQCDIYVQTSRHEGYGIAVAEARKLLKPIVCTDFTGAKEQLVNDVTGLISQFDENSITKSIIKLIDDENKRKILQDNLEKYNRNETASEINNILSYIDRW